MRTRLLGFVAGLLILPLPALSFEFDVWSSGLGLSEILATARDNDLPIAPRTLIHSNKHYNHPLASKDAGKHSSYKYLTRKDEATREDEAFRRKRAGQGRAADAGRF